MCLDKIILQNHYQTLDAIWRMQKKFKQLKILFYYYYNVTEFRNVWIYSVSGISVDSWHVSSISYTFWLCYQ